MASDNDTLISPQEQLTHQFGEQASNEDLKGASQNDIAALSASLWDLASTALGGETRVRTAPAPTIADGAARTVLEVAGPDMPFLVDSLLNSCAHLNLEVLALFHPILDLESGRRVSTIQIHVPQLSPREAEELAEAARATLADVDQTVSDFALLRGAMRDEIALLSRQRHLPADLREESIAFLEWLESEHFVFLGRRTYRFARDGNGELVADEPEMVDGSNLGVLRDETLNVLNRSSEPTVLSPEIGAFVSRREPIIIAKSTMISRVHRRVPADYVGIKHYDGDGKVSGETRFLGLFTADAYDETARSIPLVRKRVDKVISASGASEGGHSAKALGNLLETWPRDELLQTTAEALTPMLLGALHLVGRPRARLFLRPDDFDRFVTAIVFVPREAYDTQLRMQITRLLADAFAGQVTDFQPYFDQSPLARVTIHIRLEPGHPTPDIGALEAEIARLSRTWDEAFRSAVSNAEIADDTAQAAPAFRGAFNAAYREAFSPEEGLLDVVEMSELASDVPVRIRAYRKPGDANHEFRAKIYARDGSIALSRCVPVFENMGLFVDFETGYPVRPNATLAKDGPDVYWVHDVKMHKRSGAALDLADLATGFQDAFVAIWSGHAENDGFNQLVLTASASWREAALLRALAAYRKQTGMDPARLTQINALRDHPALAGQLLGLFRARFDPAIACDMDTRTSRCMALRADIEAGLADVAALDDDRVIRRIADLIMSLQRTNFYQTGADGQPRAAISFKIASQQVENLPAPKPYREIFVASPVVEGVHCRFGPVARGGLRWSDRRDDFRTEVLGLVKAQQVKNAVIVPVGSKGGFFPKHLPVGGTREAVQEAGIAAYRIFIGSLLELTDNLVSGEVEPPENTVVWDGEDPYLVVAADKGTATFSDIANEISVAHDFWLGDAFASGGSAGYDHKVMGITARGGWEAVKRHFREKSKDIQSEPFTVIGVGDMSGDVFGNGMLLSKQIRLQAAFNHLHIFIDPDPQDPERTWQERKRLFDMGRSSWSDYDTSLISEGGGILDRSAKSIALNDQIRAMTGLAGENVTPAELINAILKMDAELLWFGGIGTYVKARSESHSDAGDRFNDGLRVNADELNVAVIGEGANLGMTQAARVEYALGGGRVNTDAIDNSAGVDSSDHEVNIKILAGEAIRLGTLDAAKRNDLLKDMTEDVAEHVLAHNYDQTSALTLAQASVREDHQALERLMVYLEGRGVLDRRIEGLPDTGEMARRQEAGETLTRPEIAVLMAWSKITLIDDLVSSDVPDDPAFRETLVAYFPEAIRKFDEAIDVHRLKREIIATVLANRLLDTCGPVWLLRLREATGLQNPALARGFEAARAVLNVEKFDDAIRLLDNVVAAKAQTGMRQDAARALFLASEWFVVHRAGVSVGDAVDGVEGPLDEFKASLRETASQHAAVRIERRARELMRDGVTEPLARWSAAISYFARGIPLVVMARDTDKSVKDVAETHFRIGDALRMDRLRSNAEEAMAQAGYWDRVATRRMIDELTGHHIAMTRGALSGGGFNEWAYEREGPRRELFETLHSLGEGHGWTFSKFALSVDAVRRFLNDAENGRSLQ